MKGAEFEKVCIKRTAVFLPCYFPQKKKMKRPASISMEHDTEMPSDVKIGMWSYVNTTLDHSDLAQNQNKKYEEKLPGWGGIYNTIILMRPKLLKNCNLN